MQVGMYMRSSYSLGDAITSFEISREHRQTKYIKHYMAHIFGHKREPMALFYRIYYGYGDDVLFFIFYFLVLNNDRSNL